MTPLQHLTGEKRRPKQDLEILKILERGNRGRYSRIIVKKIREEVRRSILKMQEENCRNFNNKRKKAYLYETEISSPSHEHSFGTDLKLWAKFFGLYEVVKVKPKDQYDVRKIGQNEGPNTTSTAADHIKMWGRNCLIQPNYAMLSFCVFIVQSLCVLCFFVCFIFSSGLHGRKKKRIKHRGDQRTAEMGRCGIGCGVTTHHSLNKNSKDKTTRSSARRRK
ncbi:transposon Tf2-9 polyprotein [Trichonephila clavipes]|nr:transposon Tf2-9 polyprotein [Trichonephila clavipes]